MPAIRSANHPVSVRGIAVLLGVLDCVGSIAAQVDAAQGGDRLQRDAVIQDARALAEHGRHDEVIALLEQLPASARDYDVHHLLGEAYFRLGRLREARRSFRAALKARPNSIADLVALGDVLLAEKRYALAVESYETAERLGCDAAPLHLNLAKAYYGLGQFLGRTDQRRVPGGVAGTIVGNDYLIEPLPQSPEADVFRTAPRMSAIYHAAAARAAGPDTPSKRLLVGDIWLKAGRFDRATAIYQTLRDQVPEQERAAYFGRYAHACFGTGNVDGYLANLKQAVLLDEATYGPRLTDAYRLVAERYSAAGDLPHYVYYLDLAVQREPESAELHYLLGNACFEANRPADASRHWRIALQLRPDHPDRIQILERIRDAGANR